MSYMLGPHAAGQYAALVRNRPNDITVGAAICDTFRKLHYVFAGGVGGKLGKLPVCWRQVGHQAFLHIVLPICNDAMAAPDPVIVSALPGSPCRFLGVHGSRLQRRETLHITRSPCTFSCCVVFSASSPEAQAGSWI